MIVRSSQSCDAILSSDLHLLTAKLSVCRPIERGYAVKASLSFILLHQTTNCAYLSVHRHPWPIRVHEHTLTSVIDLKPSLTGWADSWASYVTNLSFTAEGADHRSIPINQIGQSSPIVFIVPLAISKLAIPLTALFRCAKYPLGSAITISIPSASLRSA